MTLGQNGRLGNQLFQIAAVIGHAHHYGIPFSFPQWDYQDYFNNKLPVTERGLGFRRKCEQTLDFEWLPLNDQDEHGTDLSGYFQSEKYFEACKEEVLNYLQFDESKFEHLPLIKPGTTAVHIRRGDYVNNPNYINLPVSYYSNALAHLATLTTVKEVIIFSDDIEWCKHHFLNSNFTFSEGRSEIEDLYLMSKCDYHIIANSSYSWWGAYLAGSKQVIAPNAWYDGDLTSKSTEKDIMPADWICVAQRKIRIDLKEMTFTIPVMYDHPDRRENLELCLLYLTTHFDTNIIVAEQGEHRIFSDLSRKYGSTYTFYKTDSQAFERTRLLNEMAKLAKTKYIANWDADVFISQGQIIQAIEKLEAGADMVYPYDGLFHRMPRTLKRAFQTFLNVDVFHEVPKRDIEFSQTSFGGAVFFNRDSFFQGGMENQYMVSYGPEDYERYERFSKLGFNVERVPGPLYHLDHFIGVNSNGSNPYFNHNNGCYEAVKAATTDQLQKMVESWPWYATGDTYNAKFYDEINGWSRQCAEALVKNATWPPTADSILDVGCGEGAFLAALNNPNVKGVDGGWINRDRVLIEDFEVADVAEPFDLQKKFNLVVCLEVAEHIPESKADQLITNLVNHAENYILFSAAIPGQGGNDHVNEQWQSYWANKLKALGFYPFTDYRHLAELPYFYSQNMVLYKRKEQDEEETLFPDHVLDFVSPVKYKQLLAQI